MPRRRSFMDRPLDHLTRAVASHAAMAPMDASAPAEAETGPGDGLTPEPVRPRRPQTRNKHGRFAK